MPTSGVHLTTGPALVPGQRTAGFTAAALTLLDPHRPVAQNSSHNPRVVRGVLRTATCADTAARHKLARIAEPSRMGVIYREAPTGGVGENSTGSAVRPRTWKDDRHWSSFGGSASLTSGRRSSSTSTAVWAMTSAISGAG